MFYHAVVSGSIADVCSFQQMLELLDACLVLSLLVTCSVVAAVLAEVTLIACLRDVLCLCAGSAGAKRINPLPCAIEKGGEAVTE